MAASARLPLRSLAAGEALAESVRPLAESVRPPKGEPPTLLLLVTPLLALLTPLPFFLALLPCLFVRGYEEVRTQSQSGFVVPPKKGVPALSFPLLRVFPSPLLLLTNPASDFFLPPGILVFPAPKHNSFALFAKKVGIKKKGPELVPVKPSNGQHCAAKPAYNETRL